MGLQQLCGVCGLLPVLLGTVAREAVAQASVRLVGASGASTSAGLLQVRAGSGYGWVASNCLCACVHSVWGGVAARNSVWGKRWSGGCCVPRVRVDASSMGPVLQCDATLRLVFAAGVPVAAKDLVCRGGELDVSECAYSAPDKACEDHSRD
eukprot:2249904-Amphidinium_carterae.1